MILCGYCGTRCREDGTRACDCRGASELERVVVRAAIEAPAIEASSPIARMTKAMRRAAARRREERWS